MKHSDSIDIAATPEAAFAALSDLPAMGRRSPENTGGVWLGGATGPRSARAFGHQRPRQGSWATVATVSDFDPPHRFAFNVTFGKLKVSRWVFDVESTPGGCRVTEAWPTSAAPCSARTPRPWTTTGPSSRASRSAPPSSA